MKIEDIFCDTESLVGTVESEDDDETEDFRKKLYKSCVKDFMVDYKPKKRRGKVFTGDGESDSKPLKDGVFYRPDLAPAASPPAVPDEEAETCDPPVAPVTLQTVVLDSLCLPPGWTVTASDCQPRVARIQHCQGQVTLLLQAQAGQGRHSLQAHYPGQQGQEELYRLLSQGGSWDLANLADTALSLAQEPRGPGRLLREGHEVLEPWQLHRLLEEPQQEVSLATALAGTDWRERECGVCFSSSASTCLTPCGHSFCPSCWLQWLSRSQEPRCPAPGCHLSLHPVSLAWLAGPSLLPSLQAAALQARLARDPLLHACPKPTCGRLALLSQPCQARVTCLCGLSYCPGCREGCHQPASCSQVRDLRAFSEELGRYRALEHRVEVRACPSCHTYWEKRWGCNHMMCTSCSTSFCWGCGGVHPGGSYCGRLVTPLDTVSVLPEPTETYPRGRIEAFHAFLACRLRPLSLREEERLVARELVARDRESYLAVRLGREKQGEGARQLEQELREAVAVCRAGCQVLRFSLLVWPQSRSCAALVLRGLRSLQQLLTWLREVGGRQDKHILGRRVRELRRVVSRVEKVCKSYSQAASRPTFDDNTT